jgi:putative phosphoesterase
MRVAVLADIHGNEPALRAVLAAVSFEGIDRLLVAGDLVGYYNDAAAVLKLLSDWRAEIVRGNHEDLLCGAAADETELHRLEARYGRGFRSAIKDLSTKQMQWLGSLPHPLNLEISDRRVILCHGAPWDISAYVYPDATDEAWRTFGALQADVVICGHTHYPFKRRCDSVLVLNPGSVGQPRNRVPGAHWAILDLQKLQVEHRVECYDVDAYAKLVRAANPGLPSIADVLGRR